MCIRDRYWIVVRAQVNGVWGSFGASCMVGSPPMIVLNGNNSNTSRIDREEGGMFTESAQSSMENNTSDMIAVYPNPATDYVAVETDFDNVVITIQDAQGKVVYAKRSLNGTNRIDVSGMSEGVYFMLIENNSGELLKTSKLNVLR